MAIGLVSSQTRNVSIDDRASGDVELRVRPGGGRLHSAGRRQTTRQIVSRITKVFYNRYMNTVHWPSLYISLKNGQKRRL